MHNKQIKKSRGKIKRPRKDEELSMEQRLADKQVVHGHTIGDNLDYQEPVTIDYSPREYTQFDSLESTLKQIEDSATIMLLVAALVASVGANLVLGGILLVTSGTLELLLKFLGV